MKEQLCSEPALLMGQEMQIDFIQSHHICLILTLIAGVLLCSYMFIDFAMFQHAWD
jgi:hypothetical protein